jgi:hypothetical protein
MKFFQTDVHSELVQIFDQKNKPEHLFYIRHIKIDLAEE